jgi:hypothetical protein
MVEVGMHEERRLCGLAGDDDEDDMHEDREAMFSRIADDPISVGGADDPSAPPLDGNSAKRSCPSTSPIWDDYEKLFKNINGKAVRTSMVRWPGMELGACIAIRSTLLSLVVALVKFPGILQFAL